MNIWDVGGQKSIRSYWRNYFDTTDGLIWVIDSSDKHRLLDCKAEFQNILKEERLWGSSLLVVANKQDLAGALSVEEISEILDLDQLKSTRRHCAVMSCSVYNKQSVDEAFHWVIKDIGDRIYTMR